MSDICLIGEKDYILCFQGLGITTFTVKNIEEAEDRLNEAIQEKYKFIYLTETYAEGLMPWIKELSLEPNIAITIVPALKEKKNLGIGNLRKISEKAVGVDLINKS